LEVGRDQILIPADNLSSALSLSSALKARAFAYVQNKRKPMSTAATPPASVM
jgi:hypothetical protein